MKSWRERLLRPIGGATGKGMEETVPEAEGGVGWQVTTFALARLRPDPSSAAGSSAVWESYCAWCASEQLVPLAFAVFHVEFETVAEAAGMARRQVGAHVMYDGVALLREGG